MASGKQDSSYQINLLQEMIKIQEESTKLLSIALSNLSSARIYSENDKRSFLEQYQTILGDYDFISLELAADQVLDRVMMSESINEKK